MNTIVSFGVLLLNMIFSLVITYPDYPIRTLIIWNAAVAFFVPILFLPISRTFWTAIDIAMRPLEAHEVDWAVVYASVGRDQSQAPDHPPKQDPDN